MKIIIFFFQAVCAVLLLCGCQVNTIHPDGRVNTHYFGVKGGAKIIYFDANRVNKFPYFHKFTDQNKIKTTKTIISLFNSGYYKEAISELKPLNYTANLNLNAVMGLSHLKLGKYQSAKEHFDSMRTHTPRSQLDSFLKVMDTNEVDFGSYVSLANRKVEADVKRKIEREREARNIAKKRKAERDRKLMENKLRRANERVAELERKERNRKIRRDEGWGECVQEGRMAIVSGRVAKRKEITLSGTYCGALGLMGAKARECDALKAAQKFEKKHIDVHQRVYVKKIDSYRNVTLSDGKNERVMDSKTVRDYVVCE